MPFDRLSRRHLRLWSGLVMFAYVTVHFVDLALEGALRRDALPPA